MGKELWLISGDWQIDSNPPFDRRDNGESIRFADSVFQVRRMLSEAKQRGANKLMFLGDATEHKNANSLERTTLAKLFNEANNNFDDIDAIPGNHDGSLYQVSSSTLEPVGILLPKVRYHDQFTWRDAGNGVCYVFLPYLHGVSEADIAQLFVEFFADQGSRFKDFYLFGHYGVKGCASGAANQVLAKDVLSLDTIQAHRFKRVWMGHIHKAQWIKNVGFPGSTYSHDYGERLDQKGYILYNPETDKAEFVELKMRHPLMQVDYMQLEDDLYLDACETDETFKGAIIKVVGYVPADEDAAWPAQKAMYERMLMHERKGATAVFFDVERERVYRESQSAVTTAQTLQESLQTYIKENAVKLGIVDIDATIAKAWSIIEEQPAFKQQYSDVALVSIRYRNLLSFVDETFDLAPGIHLISALNGTGKSNALGGLYFAVTGETMTGVNLAAMVRQECQSGDVDLVFRAGGDIYVLSRHLIINKSRGNATQKIALTRNGQDIKDGGNKDAQDQAEALIGLDALAFRNTVFFVQDDPLNIIQVDGRQRKNVVLSVLRMSLITSAWDVAGKLIAVENQKIATLRGKKEALDAIVFDASQEDLEKERFLKEAERLSLTDKIRTGQTSASAFTKALNEKRAEYLRLSQAYSQKGDVGQRPKSLADAWEIEKARYEKDLQALRNKRDDQAKLVETWGQEIVLKTDEIASETKRMDALKSDKREGLLKQVRDRHQAFDSEREHIYALRSELNVKQQRLLELNSHAGMPTCPTCGQDTTHLHDRGREERHTLENQTHNLRVALAEKDAAQKVATEQTQRIQTEADEILEQENGIARTIMSLRARIDTLKALIERETSDRLQTIATGKTTKESYTRDEASFNETHGRAVVEAAAAQAELDRILKELSAVRDELERLEGELEGVQIAIRACEEQQRPLDVRLGVIESQLTQMQAILRDKAEIAFLWNKAARDLLILEPLRKVFSPDGIQAAIIESARPDLERRINHYLSALRVTKFRIQIELQSASKSSDNIRETFDLLVDNGKTPMLDVRSYSGGERQLMEIAIHFALSDLAFERSGIRFPFFALDEVYDGLDAEKRQALTALIYELRADLILVVCHIEDVANSYDSIIEGTYTEEGGTKFRPKSIPIRGGNAVEPKQVQGKEGDADKGRNQSKGTKR